ncbi:uncharacterized protein I303_100884 [Kwoniella dejecticola CBS 10117]|uniref:non-specific serine/threonine protein kinase n=1 Tax=Kwoniella dejecticola CBS 10117 TaxID=1296121 RepID=A0A1A6AG64_9TREE|nr:CMGC/DYRK/PRP4 protein kinase [Kwoniella dejecticola CBS 10117]OBR89065.1 CMGC/DYRK/PRP4 protein kinase [Kwoniella dejecticola CBS 10117]
MASSGIKRPHNEESHAFGRHDRDRDREGDRGHRRSRNDEAENDRRSKPKDWRDAFLDEDEQPRRRRSRSRERDYNRRRDEHKERDRRYSRDYDDRDRDRRRGGGGLDYRDRDRDRDRERDRDHREREPEKGDGYHKRHSDRNDSSSRHDDKSKITKNDDREEGELEPTPPKSSVPLPVAKAPSASPSRSSVTTSPSRPLNRPPPAGPKASFQSLAIPSQPRASGSARPPPPSNRFFEAESSAQAATVEDAKAAEEEEPISVLEEEVDTEKILAERRRKREEIMAKFKANGGKPTNASTPQVAPGELSGPGTGAESVTSAGTRTGYQTGLSITGATPLLRQLGTHSVTNTLAPTPIANSPALASTPMGNDFDLTKQADSAGEAELPASTRGEGVGADMMISAADYDPTQDMMADQEKRRKDMEAIQVKPSEVASGVGEPIVVDDQPEKPAEEEWEEVEIEEDEEEEDEFDMFATFGDEPKEKKKRKVTVRRLKNANGVTNGAQKPQVVKKPASTIAAEVVDNVDDTEGYYRITPGEILDDGRYQVTITLGKGMFSAVVKAKVLKAVKQERRQDVVGKEVAIKVIRSQESMYVAGRKESQIIKRLNDADPEDKKHIVRMERTFEHKGHLCIVTESMSMNLRDVIKRFGKDVGLNMRAVRAYSHQLFLALSLMRKCAIVHADIKPDNVLVSENKATLKVCDLGSAAEISEGEITPYLVSRFYRAPEIILGLPYDTAIDMWSIGCTLYELYTGKILFPGRSNNHMLLLQMELKGKINHRMIKKANFGNLHFDESLNFISIEKDKITNQDVAKTLVISKATKDLRARLLPPSSVQLKMKDEELKQLTNFIDLLDKCLQLDPSRRISPRDALMHPFLTSTHYVV